MYLHQMAQELKLQSKLWVNSELAKLKGLTYTPLNSKEYAKYNISDNIDPTKVKAGIHIPLIKVHEFLFDLRFCKVPLYLAIKLLLKRDLKEYIDDDILIIWYVLFHEDGHYFDFINSGKTAVEFLEQDCLEERQKIDNMILEVKHSNIPQEEKNSKLVTMHCDYYCNLPLEKAANEYAFRQIDSKLKQIQGKC
jgi:hypothetical protein